MDETLTVPSQAVKTAGQTLSWKSKFKHFDLQQQQQQQRPSAPPTSSAGMVLTERENKSNMKTEFGWLYCDCDDQRNC